MAKHSIDLTPLKKYPDFRNLWAAGLISYLGSMITYVAIPFQIKELTNSYLAVGIVGAIELVPLIVFGLYGGVLADSVNRKKMVWATEAGAMLLVALLLANSMLWEPKVWVIYIAAGLFAVVDGLQRPSADAMLPRLVGHQDLPAATALMSLRWQLGLIVGPTVGGIIFSTFSISAGFAVDMATYVVALVFLARVRSMPSSKEAKKPSLAALLDGVKYAFSRQDLIGTYIIDLAAMTLAMPMALYPFWADQLNAPWALGMFYSAITVGSVLVTVTSGWTTRYRFHGRAVILAAIGWGLAIAVAGLSTSLVLVLLFLTIAGAFDMISALFRANIWNQTIPDHFRGRLAGIELLSYSVGPLAGQLRAATIASATSLSFSVTSGGILCAIVVAFLAFFLPKMWKYDVETNEFAVRERQNRKNLENS
ncbi:major facilitator superfamily protein [Candidatus Planktophila versatilis]|uniref:Major facilitator superfamily protein n=1 Tax=Candidatus Planktophila versatilis TaxID=1884905 RepID=A0AAC9YUZ8_9ACTN|nr:MFS transporter [Candidatus Planktophila versatilis]ASY18258.1 major facilitator superfamily protein [Candidatus Planktophila versatilis]ASY22288.1 major facilitator superfamily protein [Candidatus Planktophila versatilis]